MPPINILVKPASSLCNLKCRYCFYHDIAESREVPSYGKMPMDTLEALVRRVFEYADRSCTFAFQGGEPTLVGLEYYERLLELQQKYNTKGLHIQNAIQTNGILLDEAWAGFLAQHKFLVGLSLDGDRQLNDRYRLDAAGRGAFTRIMNAARLLDRHRASYNILCVVTHDLARHGQQVYRFMKANGFRHLQFIPCLVGFGQQGRFSPSPERYAAFLNATFDEYYLDFINGNEISIRLFDNYIEMLAGRQPECCGMNGVCSFNLVVESDGSVYPCDFYVLDRYRLGSIQEHSIQDIQKASAAHEFEENSRTVDAQCSECNWFPLCRGGCRRYREHTPGAPLSRNRYCESYRSFFAYAYQRMAQMADLLITSVPR